MLNFRIKRNFVKGLLFFLIIVSFKSAASEDSLWDVLICKTDKGITFSKKIYKKTSDKAEDYLNTSWNFYTNHKGKTIAGVSAAIGATASTIGIITITEASAGVATLATISAGGTVAGGMTGGIIGSGIGIATCGTAIVGTIPLISIGAISGGSLALNVATFLGIGATAPAWAFPVSIAGGVIFVGAGSYFVYEYFFDNNETVAKVKVLQVEKNSLSEK